MRQRCVCRAVALAVSLLAVAFLAPASASARFSELSQFAGTLNCPGAIAYDPGGNGRSATVYVADPCFDGTGTAKGFVSGLYAYQAGGTPESSYNGGSGEIDTFTYTGYTYCFDYLGGAALDPAAGELYLSDQGSAPGGALFEFDHRGVDDDQAGSPETSCNSHGPLQDAFAEAVRASTAIANTPGTISAPQGLAIYDGNLYAAGGGAVVSTPLGSDLGSPVNSFPLNSSDSAPIALAIDPNSGTMFVLDNGAHKGVYEYNAASGSYLGVLATGFGATPFTTPTAIAVDPVAHVVYVADAGSGTVDTFAEGSGAPLLQTPVLSNEYPYGVALDTTGHVLYVADEEGQGPNTSGGLVERFSYTPAPTCTAPAASTKGGVAVALSLSCTDAAGASVTYAITANPAHGTLSAFNPATGAVTYTPNSGYDGTDTFTYTGSSVDGTSAPTTVTVNVTGPTCAPETLATGYQAAVTVTLACSDSASPVTSYTIIDAPAHGVASTPSSTGTFTYTPSTLFVGVETLTFEATTAAAETSAPETITIYVGTPLPPPVEGSSANLYFAYGAVTVLLPGQTTPISLSGGLQAPLGSVVNTTNGGVGVFVENNGQVQAANFWNGSYQLTQSGDPHTILHLLGKKIPTVRCAIHPRSFSGRFSLGEARSLGPRREAPLELLASKFHERTKPARQLWGSGHGSFTTVGNGSSASVRGTEWAIFDYPDGTLTFDYTDSVSVDDFHLHKTIVITAGHYYFAALGNLPACAKEPTR